jgi:hypothetical protein
MNVSDTDNGRGMKMRQVGERSAWMKGLTALAMITAVLAAGAGCTKKKPLISKVDTDAYVKKADFDGKTFHLVRAIEEADSNNTLDAFPGFAQDFGLVRAEVTETELKFFTAFDPMGRDRTAKLIASYPIRRHFDIERDRNDFGEQSNRIVEKSERPWRQRSYMRVDWSNPRNTLAKFTVQLGESPVREESAQMVEDLRIDKNGVISWMTESTIGGGRLYRFIAPFGFENISSFRVTHRTQLIPAKPVDPSFQPVSYGLKDFERFGYFVTQQNVIADPNKGLRDKDLKIFAETYNVCEGTSTRPCAKNKVTWYLTKDFPEKYLPEARLAVAQWNESFQKALGRTDTVIELDESKQVALSDSTVNTIAYYPHNTSGGLLGVRQNVVDPRTGEILTSRAAVYEDGIRGTVALIDTLIDAMSSQDPLKDVIGTDMFGIRSPWTTPYTLPQVKQQSETLNRVLGIKATPGQRGSSGTIEQQVNIAARKSHSSASAVNARKKEFMASGAAAQFFKLAEVDAIGGLSLPSDVMAPVDQTLNPALKGLDQVMFVGDLVREEKRRMIQQATMGVHSIELVDEAAMRYILKKVQQIGVTKVADARENIKQDIAKLTFFTTLLHEMGHAFGLRHNFQASADRTNYHSKYHELLQKIGKDGDVSVEDLDPYTYSSVMDYGADFYSAAAGLGPYDTAAIRYAYNRSIDRDTDPETVGKNFKFCTDHQVGDSILCRRFDKGSNVTEVTFNAIKKYHREWPLRAFRRDRTLFDMNARGYLGGLLTRTMVPVRQVMDEFFFMLVVGEQVPGNLRAQGKCPQAFMFGSIEAGEFHNICNPVEAVQAGVDPENLATWANGLRDDKVPPSFYQPYGLADLIFANELAKSFFAEVIGSTQPGVFLVRSTQVQGQYTLARLPQNGTDQQRLAFYGQRVLGLEGNDLNKFVEQNIDLVVDIGVSRYGRPFNLTVAREAGFSRLTSIGSYFDKMAAIWALTARDLGTAKYNLVSAAESSISMFGSPYLYPHTKEYTLGMIRQMVSGDTAIAAIPVTFTRGKHRGRSVQVIVPAAMDDSLRTTATIEALTSMVFDQDKSMVSKLRVCKVDDAGCLAQLEGQQTISFTSSEGDNTYRATQTRTGDSIAFMLISQAKALDDQRREARTALEQAEGQRAGAITGLVGKEEVRSRMRENIAKVAELKPLESVIGQNGDESEWSKVLLLTENLDQFSQSVTVGIALPIYQNFVGARNLVTEQLRGMGNRGQCPGAAADSACRNSPDAQRRAVLEELMKDFDEIVQIVEAILSQNLTNRATKSSIEQTTAELADLESNIDLIHRVMKVLGY